MAMPLPAGLQNSHQNGGSVFLIFVADPRTGCPTTVRDLIELLRDHHVGRVVQCEDGKFADLTGLGRCP
jgi:hypothetical protein